MQSFLVVILARSKDMVNPDTKDMVNPDTGMVNPDIEEMVNYVRGGLKKMIYVIYNGGKANVAERMRHVTR